MLSSRSLTAIKFMETLAAVPTGGSRSLLDISKNEHLPHAYLEQITPCLKKAGLIVSSRGPYGGYKLNKPSSTISLLDIVNAVDAIQKTKNNHGGISSQTSADLSALVSDYLANKFIQ